jgi:benzoyl-CoA reductase/2-hydroxyglutaryl-CoA dehydratase subunit BcrC/BadD/HgdB
LHPVKNERFFTTIMDPPMKGDKNNLEYYKVQLRKNILLPLQEHYGVDISDEAIRTAIDDHNAVSAIIEAIGDHRRAANPNITGYEFHVIQLVSQVCPHELILPYLRETLWELEKREPEPKFPFRARVALVGSEVDDPDFTKLIESCGAMVVADRYCFGMFPSRETIEIKAGESAFDAIARHYLETNLCARFMDPMKIDQRHDVLESLSKDFNADGIIIQNMKFCEFWSYEKVLASNIFINELHVPTCTIEKEYALGAVGQLRTRFQAFIESLEIKQIHGGK